MCTLYSITLILPSIQFQIVTKISSELTEETKQFIKEELSEETKENQKLWGEHIVIKCVPYRPAKKHLPRLTTKLATANIGDDFSMKYSVQPQILQPVEKNIVKQVPESKVSDHKNET